MATGSTPSPRRPLARPAPDAGLARAYFGAAVGIGLLAAALAKVAGDGVSPLLLMLVPLEVAAGTALLLGRAPSWALAWAAADLGASAAVLGDVGAAALVPAALALMSTALVASRWRAGPGRRS